MTQKEKIAKILSQKNYSVVKGRVHRYDVLDDKFKPVPVSGNRIPLVRDGSVVEIFNMSDVLSVIDGLNGAAKKLPDNFKDYKKVGVINSDGSIDDIPITITPRKDPFAQVFKEARKIAKKHMGINDENAISKPVRKKKSVPTKKSKKKNQKLRENEIKYIRDNYLSISINKMAIKLGVGRLTVGYIVKQIKAGKTLKYENK